MPSGQSIREKFVSWSLILAKAYAPKKPIIAANEDIFSTRPICVADFRSEETPISLVLPGDTLQQPQPKPKPEKRPLFFASHKVNSDKCCRKRGGIGQLPKGAGNLPARKQQVEVGAAAAVVPVKAQAKQVPVVDSTTTVDAEKQLKKKEKIVRSEENSKIKMINAVIPQDEPTVECDSTTLSDLEVAEQ